MLLNFKNEYIYFALANLWGSPDLDYKFKFNVNALCTANPDDQFVQSINVPDDIIVQIYRDLTSRPEGMASVINHEMLADLGPQIAAVSNLADYQAYLTAKTNYATYLSNLDAYNNYVNQKAAYDAYEAAITADPQATIPIVVQPAVVAQPAVVNSPTAVIANEGALVQMALGRIDQANGDLRASKTASGKEQILK